MDAASLSNQMNGHGGIPVDTPIWINGQVMPLAQASIGVEDRGYQFADGVYEVVRFYNGRFFTLREHMERLARSAEGIRLPLPMPIEQLQHELRNFLPLTNLRDGFIYLQLTRGVAERNHRFPKQQGHTLLWHARPLPPAKEAGEGEGVKLLSLADERWKRCWIKSIGLIANVLAKNDAVEAGYDEAVFVDREIITECSSSNIFAVLGGTLITHPVGAKVLPGITRLVVLDVAARLGIRVEERALREEEVRRADELFITSTTREVHWVQRYNDRYIGQGRCGAITIKLHRAFQDRVRAETAREIAA
jgi:D-alanine transaminase